MNKTSVYLAEGQKASLGALAQRTGRSEADLIRLAIDRLVRTNAFEPEAGSAPTGPPLPRGPLLVGVGVGPGNPDLVLDRARRWLRGAGRVFAASTSLEAVGRAEAILRVVDPDVAVERLVFHIAPGQEARQASLVAAADRVVTALDADELVAFVTLGDPNLFSVFPALERQVRRRRPGTPVDTVPGVLPFQELAARTNTVIAEDGELVVLVTLGDDQVTLADLLARRDATVVTCKGGRHLPALADILAQLDRLEETVVGELFGQPGERTGPLRPGADRPGAYLATAIVPAQRGDR